MHYCNIMKNQIVIINIGNTHTKKEVFSNKENSLEAEIYPTNDINESIVKSNEFALISSVVREKTDILKGLSNTFIINSSINLNFSKKDIDTSTLGSDRIANLIALADLAKKSEIRLPALSIDFGTAITFELLDESYNFLGGAIMPGRELLRKTLNDNTSGLPLVDITEKYNSNIGRNTKESILIGVDLGVIGAVEKVIEGFKETINIKTIIATGGDADFFVKQIKNLELCNSLTRNGIIKAWELNQ